MASAPAQSQSLHVSGKAGHLSEWELEGELTEAIPGELLGSVTWKHIGLCSVHGPQEKQGEIRMRLSKSGPFQHLAAQMSFEGQQCTYEAKYSGSFSGYMDCSGFKGIPVSISIK
jgi:hypothetical protein